MLTYLVSSIVLEFSHSKIQMSEIAIYNDLRKIFCGCQRMAKVSYGEKRPESAKTNSTLKR